MRQQRLGRLGCGLLALSFLGCEAMQMPAEGLPEAPSEVARVQSALTQVSSFGTNPGNLKMWTHVPASMPANAPLIVALHGCTQTAAGYEATGWSALANQLKFYVV